MNKKHHSRCVVRAGQVCCIVIDGTPVMLPPPAPDLCDIFASLEGPSHKSLCGQCVRRSEIYRERSAAASFWNELLLYSPCVAVTHFLSGMVIYEGRLLFILPHRSDSLKVLFTNLRKRWIRESQCWCVKWLKRALLGKQLVCFHIDSIEGGRVRPSVGRGSSWRLGRGPVLRPHPFALDFCAAMFDWVNIARWSEQRINTDVEEALLTTGRLVSSSGQCWGRQRWTTMQLTRHLPRLSS